MSDTTHSHVPASGIIQTGEEAAYELRCAESALWTGSRLAIACATFLFAGLGFAYFYLRSSNSSNLWRPGGVTAPGGLGTAIFALTVTAAVLATFGTLRMRRGSTVDWEVAGWMAVLAGLIAAGLQVFELTRLGFAPGSSGYASCVVGWGPLNTGLLLGASYWLETLLARSIRLRRALAEDGGAAVSQLAPAKLFRASVEGCTYFWGYAAVVSLVFWLLFYEVH